MGIKISWAAYLETVALLVTVYYLVVVPFCYKHELNLLLKRKAGGLDKTPAPVTPTSDLPHFQSLSDEVEAFTREAARNGFTKDQILFSMQVLLSKYPFTKTADAGAPVQRLIAQACQTNCSIHLNEEELNVLLEE